MAGLVASTVTPGSTPPDASRTVPVKVPCANARDGSKTMAANIAKHFNVPRMTSPSSEWSPRRRTHRGARRKFPFPPEFAGILDVAGRVTGNTDGETLLCQSGITGMNACVQKWARLASTAVSKSQRQAYLLRKKARSREAGVKRPRGLEASCIQEPSGWTTRRRQPQPGGRPG